MADDDDEIDLSVAEIEELSKLPDPRPPDVLKEVEERRRLAFDMLRSEMLRRSIS